jgi:hypothetical protein
MKIERDYDSGVEKTRSSDRTSNAFPTEMLFAKGQPEYVAYKIFYLCRASEIAGDIAQGFGSGDILGRRTSQIDCDGDSGRGSGNS